MLGVGFDTQDGQIRLTKAEQYQIMMGSDETHKALQNICSAIDETIKKSGRSLCDYTPEEFMEMVQTLY